MKQPFSFAFPHYGYLATRASPASDIAYVRECNGTTVQIFRGGHYGSHVSSVLVPPSSASWSRANAGQASGAGDGSYYCAVTYASLDVAMWAQNAYGYPPFQDVLTGWEVTPVLLDS